MNLPETLQISGSLVRLNVRRNAKKNIIVRAPSADMLQISAPPWLSARKLLQWLDDNQTMLQNILAQAAARRTTPEKTPPDELFYLGKRLPLRLHPSPRAELNNATFWLPEQPWQIQKTALRNLLWQQATAVLLPRLAEKSRELSLQPAAIQLSRAKTFWGVCRSRTGIRLNWRLIGAPMDVIDYVCVHELCHLVHADHSVRFWNLVNRHTPHTAFAKQWLRQHGSELFVLD